MEKTARNYELDPKTKKVLEIYFETGTELSKPSSKKKNVFETKIKLWVSQWIRHVGGENEETMHRFDGGTS
jgi:hypothetical protein